MTHLRVRELVEAKCWTITRLARKAQLAYSTAHDYYHDKPRQYDKNTLERIASALEVKVSDLFGGDPAPRWDDGRALH